MLSSLSIIPLSMSNNMTQFKHFYFDTNNRIGQLPQREASVCPAQLHSLPDLQGECVCFLKSTEKTDSRTISNAETASKEKLMDLQG